MSEEREPATCRHCRMKLDGVDYMFGGRARHPRTKEQVPSNYYGGYVCSSRCDYQASLELEQSMPGHGCQQKSLSPASEAYRHYRANWPEA